MEVDISWMVGRAFEHVSFLEPMHWRFSFAGGGCILSDSPWRLIVERHLSVCSQDHGQLFGLPKPVDVLAEARPLLVGRQIQSAQVRDDTRDVVVTFSPDTRLEFLAVSRGYESWEIWTPDGALVVGQE